MSGSVPAPLLFAAHLFGFLVALAAAFALGRERDRALAARVTGALGFLALAAAEAYHGAGFAGEAGSLVLLIRTGGFVLLLLAAVPPVRRIEAPAALAVPGGVAPPAAAAAAAGLLTAWRRRGERGGLALGLGLLLLGASAALLALPERPALPAAVHGLAVVGYMFVGRTVIALTRASLRFRFMVGFAGLLLAVVLFVSFTIGTVIDRNLRQGALERVVGQAEEAQNRLEGLAASQVMPLASLGQLTAISDALERGRGIAPEAMEDLQERLFPQTDFILFLDLGGSVRGRFGLSVAGAVDLTGTEVVTFAMESGGPVASLDALGDRRLALIGVAPIKPARGPQPVGFAVAGFLVDGELVAREVVAGRGSRAAVFRGFRGTPPLLVASAGFPEDARIASDELVDQAFDRLLASGRTERRAVRLADAEHFAAFTPLRQPNDSVVGMLVVAEPAEVLAQTQRQVNRLLFLITVAVIGLAFLLALVAARRITRPLESLTGAARRVQAGEIEAKADVQGEDEVADLAGAFNRMTDSLTAMTAELRLAAEEQSRLRARLETVVNSMGDGLIAVDDEGRVVAYNPAAGAIVGIPRSRVVGRPLKEILHGRDATGRSLAARRGAPSGPAFVRRPDETEVPVAITTSPLRDADGTQLGRVYVLRDMTREYEVERMKTEFLSNVSHELRTPLTPIIGYSEILMRRKIPSEQTRDFARGILESARRLERIVSMLVDFSAIEGGRIALRTEPTPLRPAIRDVVDAWRPRSKKHRFASRIAAGLPPALVNPDLLRRILDELLDNAVKYSPEGGRILVSARADDGDRGMLRVEVADQGIGIEPEDLARIFQDFRQLDASDTRAFGGLGLGLTFVQRLVEVHGGTVSAESQPGRGATFTFTLPAADGSRRGTTGLAERRAEESTIGR